MFAHVLIARVFGYYTTGCLLEVVLLNTQLLVLSRSIAIAANFIRDALKELDHGPDIANSNAEAHFCFKCGVGSEDVRYRKKQLKTLARTWKCEAFRIRLLFII